MPDHCTKTQDWFITSWVILLKRNKPWKWITDRRNKKVSDQSTMLTSHIEHHCRRVYNITPRCMEKLSEGSYKQVTFELWELMTRRESLHQRCGLVTENLYWATGLRGLQLLIQIKRHTMWIITFWDRLFYPQIKNSCQPNLLVCCLMRNGICTLENLKVNLNIIWVHRNDSVDLCFTRNVKQTHNFHKNAETAVI